MTQLSTLNGAPMSSLCFGTMQFGGTADVDVSLAMYDACRKIGVNHFDTAHVYTGGASETLLGQLIANGDTDWQGNLIAAHHKLHLMEQKMLAGDDSQKEDWKRYDWEFHLALIEACGSQNLLSLHSVLYDKYLRYQMLVLTYRGEEAVEEHRKVFEAALARDIDTAAETLKTHIDKGLEHTLAAF